MSGRGHDSGDERRESQRRGGERRGPDRRGGAAAREGADDDAHVRGESDAPLRIAPLRKRRSTATVERLGDPVQPSWVDTGELRIQDEDYSGVFHVEDLTKSQVAPVVDPTTPVRPRGPAERFLRLTLGLVLSVAVLVVFGPTFVHLGKRLAGGTVFDDWRARPVRIESNPSGAAVFIAGKRIGTTPLQTRARCLGRTIDVRIELPSHEIWQWSGICTSSDPLRLRALLTHR